MKEIISLLPKEALVSLLILLGGLVVWFVHRGIEQVRKIVKAKEDEQAKEFDKINDTLDKIFNKIDLDCEGTKASLYYNIDQLLTTAELFNVWSSQLKETYEKMHRSYMKLGNGYDNGETFSVRAKNIEVNDTKFHDMISTYNKNRRKLFLEHLEKTEAMF